MKKLLALVLLASACSTPTRQLSVLSGVAPDVAPGAAEVVATEGFQLVWDNKESPIVADLLAEYARVTGQTVLMSAESRTQIQKKKIYKAGGKDVLDIPAEEVVAVTEGLLIMNNFVLIPLHEREPRVLQVISLETQERNQVKRSAQFVRIEDLPAYANRPARLLTTSLELPNTDVRTLSNSMRTMLTDANTQQIIPVGNSNGLILTGFATDLVDLVEMLRKIDASTAPAPKKAAEGASER